jgi:histidine phosphotransferase ChpT
MGGALGLAGLLASRLCHDISGPLAGVASGLELALDEAPRSEALDAAENAARVLSARLRLLRAAWGPEASPLSLAEIEALAEGLPGAPRTRADLSALSARPELSPKLARVLLNALLLGAEALKGEGRITAALAGMDIVLVIEGRRAAWPADLARILHDPEPMLASLESPRDLQAPFAALIAREAGISLSLMLAPGDAPPALLIAG